MRISFTGNGNEFQSIMEDSIISHSNGFSSAVPNLIIMTDSSDNFHRRRRHGAGHPQKGAANHTSSCNFRGMFQCTKVDECYNFLQICDHICDCSNDCIDENQCLETFPSSSETSLVLEESAFNDFWKVVKLPSNGTLSLRVPFATQGKLYLEANSLGSRGVSNLGSRIISVGTNVRFHMELPQRANLGETLSLRISGINEGNIHIRRTFGFYSSAFKSFTFVSANDVLLVRINSIFHIDFHLKGGSM